MPWKMQFRCSNCGRVIEIRMPTIIREEETIEDIARKIAESLASHPGAKEVKLTYEGGFESKTIRF